MGRSVSNKTTSLPSPPIYEICSVLIVPPSGSPSKVPVTASTPSLAIIINSSPRVGVNPSATPRVAPPRSTVPVTLS